jgi:hypothetical protein
VSLLETRATPAPLKPNRRAWGTTLAVPYRSQVDYPEGVQSWCSPTSTAMVLAFWAQRLRRPDLDLDVPVVAQGVNDPKWPGTGNWPFNTAFAGALPGMRACVARLSDVAELEDWIQSGLPVVVSVSYDVLRGKPKPSAGDGHLVVCIGFTSQGDVVVHDPGTRNGARRTFPRADLSKAWATSHNTVYLIYPQTARLPKDRWRHWHSPKGRPR